MARRTARGDVRVDGALLAVALLLSLIALALPDGRAESVAASVRAALGPLVQVQARFEMARRVIASNDSTRAPADSVVMRALDATGLAAENAQLRALLALGDRLRWGFVPGELVHPATQGETYTLLLSRGARDGIEPFNGVLAPDGVVGTVRSVDARTSIVLTWPHPDFRVSAMSADGNVAGIVGAHLGVAADRFLLEFRGVPFRTALDSGEVIVSSGAGGVFPRGAPVGVVLREIETSEGWSRTYLLRPAVHPSEVGAVVVLRAERALLGVADAYAPLPPVPLPAVPALVVPPADTGGRR